uniref:Protein-tyrosine sulfotransferase n=1 Tax=Rhabditophanes sp. KR3021 TaxID=114890 RepID=A0AC35U8K1_9BILA
MIPILRVKGFKICLGILFILVLVSIFSRLNNRDGIRQNAHVISGHVSSKIENFTYDNNSPFIFVGGMPRSGTTLMRIMMDAHPKVRCGEETRVIPRILSMRNQWQRSEKEWKRLKEAGVTEEVIDAAVTAFINNIIVGHGKPAERLCNKDPFTLKSTTYLAKVYPNGKFLLMIRDGRATIHSVISRKVTITGFNLDDFRQCMIRWNAGIEIMYKQCLEVGSSQCMLVHYEQLVLHPRKMMTKILTFLDLPWADSVLHHENFIGDKISLSKVERSSDQVVKPLNLDALTKWVGTIPEDVVKEMDQIAPMLRILGYDPNANPPNYGKPDEEVQKKTADLHRDAEKWYQKAIAAVNDPERVDKPLSV